MKKLFLLICSLLIFGTWFSLSSLEREPFRWPPDFSLNVASGATPISGLDELSTLNGNDLIPVVDVSDTSMSANGTNKKLQASNLPTVFGEDSISGVSVDIDPGVTVQQQGAMSNTHLLTIGIKGASGVSVSVGGTSIYFTGPGPGEISGASIAAAYGAPGTTSGSSIAPSVFGVNAITGVTAPGTGVTIQSSDNTSSRTGLSTFQIDATSGVSVSTGGDTIYITGPGDHSISGSSLAPSVLASQSISGTSILRNTRTYSIPFFLDARSAVSIITGSSVFGGVSRFKVADSGGSLYGVSLVVYPEAGATVQFYRSNKSFPEATGANSLLNGSGVSTLSGGGTPCIDDSLGGVTSINVGDIITIQAEADSGVCYLQTQLRIVKD